MPLTKAVRPEEEVELEDQRIEDMLIMVDQLSQTLEVMSGVVNRLQNRIVEISSCQENLALEMSPEEFLADYEDPYAARH